MRRSILTRKLWSICLSYSIGRESDASAERINEDLVQYGFGLWAVEVIGVADFIGFTGLALPGFTAYSLPAWKSAGDSRGIIGVLVLLRRPPAARDYGFSQMGLEQIVSFTVPSNQRSRNVMGRIGMTHSPDDDFEHPLLPDGHPLRHHVLYRLTRCARRVVNHVVDRPF